jgi:hypothetical protein
MRNLCVKNSSETEGASFEIEQSKSSRWNLLLLGVLAGGGGRQKSPRGWRERGGFFKKKFRSKPETNNKTENFLFQHKMICILSEGGKFGILLSSSIQLD